MSMAKIRVRRSIQLIGAGGWSASVCLGHFGTMRLRCSKLGANTLFADGCKPSVLSPELLAEVYGVKLRVTEVDGFFVAN